MRRIPVVDNRLTWECPAPALYTGVNFSGVRLNRNDSGVKINFCRGECGKMCSLKPAENLLHSVCTVGKLRRYISIGKSLISKKKMLHMFFADWEHFRGG